MESFNPWDVVKVPFPYTKGSTREYRPALVIASIDEGPGLLWVLMITSARNRSWPGDVPVADLDSAGLPAPSVVRTAKVATVDAEVAHNLGVLSAQERAAIAQCLVNRFPSRLS